MIVPKKITIATVKDGGLSTYQRLYWLDKLIVEMSEPLDTDYGAGNWAIVPTDELPADFSVETYTIENGQLVPASPEVIAEREAAKRAAFNEAQRLKREAEYRATTDPRVLEIIADSTPSMVAMKDAIREKYPYKEPPAVTPVETSAI